MHTLYDKWWKEKSPGTCNKESKDANSLGVGNVGGVFVVLLIGMACSVLVAIFEFVWKARKNADEDKVIHVRISSNRLLRCCQGCTGVVRLLLSL
jgi:hypothetical protein